MLAVPILAFAIDPLTAAALLLPIYLISDVYGIWLYRREFSARNLTILIPGGLAGILIGYLIAPVVSTAALTLGVGLIGVTFCLWTWIGTAAASKPRPARVLPGIVWGTLSGITSFITHAGAPPYQTYMLPQKLPKLVFAGTSTIFFATINFAKLPPYLALNQFPDFEPGPTALLIAVAIIGAFTGSRTTRILPEALFYRIVQVALFAVSLRLIWKAVDDLAG